MDRAPKHKYFKTRFISRLELKKALFCLTCMNKEKLMTDIDTDNKLALVSDCPFLMCVFYVLSNEMMSQ